MMYVIFLKIFCSAIVMGVLVFGREKVLFHKSSTLPGLLNSSTPICRLWNDVVSSRIECAKLCAKDDQCVLFTYDKSGNCSTYCGFETDLEGTVYIATSGMNIVFFFFYFFFF